MERDMEAIRDVMLAVRQSNTVVRAVDGMADDVFKYNAMLAIDGGLAVGKYQKGRMDSSPVPIAAIVSDLTFAGHDFIDGAKDAEIWGIVKKRMLKPTAAWTFGLIAELIKEEIKKKFGA